MYVVSVPTGDRADLAYDNAVLDELTELFDNAENNLPDDILSAQPDTKVHLAPNHM